MSALQTSDEFSSIHWKFKSCPSAVKYNDLAALEWFVVQMFDMFSDVTTVNEASLNPHS